MLNLAATTDRVQVVTGQAVPVDVTSDWVDYSGSGSSSVTTPGNTGTAITAAGTYDIVPAPAASVYRNVRQMTIRNRDAVLSVDVTVRRIIGAATLECVRMTLTAGDTLQYAESYGFFKVANPVSPPNASYTTADQVIAAATTAYVVASDIRSSAGRPFRVGTTLQWKIWLSKTAAGIAARTLDVRFGLAGSTADTSRASFAVTPTAVVDAGQYLVMATFRTIGATGVVSIGAILLHNGATTGLSTGAAANSLTNATFDNSNVALVAGISITTGAAEVLTITQVNSEVDNI